MSAGKKGLPQSFFRRIFFDEPRRIERTVACSDFHSVFVVHSVAEQQEQIIWHWVEQMRRRSAGEEQQRVEGGLAWKETLMRSIQEGRETRRTMWEQQKAWPGGGGQLKNADLAAGRRLSLSCRFVHAQVFSQPLISQRRGIVFLCVSFVDTQRATSSREAWKQTLSQILAMVFIEWTLRGWHCETESTRLKSQQL